MIADPFDCTLTEARQGTKDARRDERRYHMDRELDTYTLRELVRNNTNARRA